jgi:ABC-2 type transport system permease protein
MKWRFHLFTLEIRKTLSYRVDFWVQFVASIGIHVAVAYFLFKAIFEFNKLTELGGYRLDTIILYYFFVPFIQRMTQSQEDYGLSKEIYDGGFNKYLIYPVDVVTYKFMSHIGYAFVGFMQLVLALIIIFAFSQVPPDMNLNLKSFLMFLPLTLLCSYVVFIMMFSLELIAFWADTVWSLVVMLRLTMQLLGGMMIPLEMFPEPLRTTVGYLPFQFSTSIPIRCLMGKIDWPEYLQLLTIGTFWAAITTLVAYAILRRGLKSYTGVGI